MDLNFLPPLIAGVVLSFLVSLATSAVNRAYEDKLRTEDRNHQVADRKDNLGREAAQRLLKDLLKMQDTTVRGHFPGVKNGFEFDFVEDQLRDAAVDNVLVTEPSVRNAVSRGLSVLPVLHAGMPDLTQHPFVAQREALADMVRIVSAYIREDDIPAELIDRIEAKRQVVEEYFALLEREDPSER